MMKLTLLLALLLVFSSHVLCDQHGDGSAIGNVTSRFSQTFEAMKDKGEIVFRRAMESINVGLNDARIRADQLLKDPVVNESISRVVNPIKKLLSRINNSGPVVRTNKDEAKPAYSSEHTSAQ